MRALGPISGAAVAALAAQLFNETWRLLEQERRTRDADDRLIHAAHTSRYYRYYWARFRPGPRRTWLAAMADIPCLHSARAGRARAAPRPRAIDLCQENGIGDWDLAFGYEALARVHTVADDVGRAWEYTDQAPAAAEDIADDEDRDMILADLENHSPPATVLVASPGLRHERRLGDRSEGWAKYFDAAPQAGGTSEPPVTG